MELNTTNKDHYDIMAALRGPDGEIHFAGRCKVLFTARIRYWIGCDISSGGVIRGGVIRGFETEDDLVQQVLDSAPKEAPAWWPHYGGHVRQALRALKMLPPKSLRDFSQDEAKRLLMALDEINATLY